MSSMIKQCRDWSIGCGTGKPCSCRTCERAYPVSLARGSPGNLDSVEWTCRDLNDCRTFMKAYSLMAANRDMYIQLADCPLRR
jgi:hypothetical protein